MAGSCRNPDTRLAVGPHTIHPCLCRAGRFRRSLPALSRHWRDNIQEGEFTVTPTPSLTMSQLVLTPVGTLSVFGFKTPIPYPFGAERTGYLVTDIDAAVRAARAHGAALTARHFRPDRSRRHHSVARRRQHGSSIAHDGGISRAANRPGEPGLRLAGFADAFIRDFVAFAHGKIVCWTTVRARRGDRPTNRYLPTRPPRIRLRRVAVLVTMASSLSLWTEGDGLRGLRALCDGRQG